MKKGDAWGVCTRCRDPFDLVALAPVARPDLCGRCWIQVSDPRNTVTDPTPLRPPPELATTVATVSLATEIAAESSMAISARDSLRDLPVSTPEQIKIASELLVDIKGRYKVLEERLQEITKPLNAGLKSVRDLFRPPMDAYTEAERILKQKIADAHAAIEAANRAAMFAAQQQLAQGDVRGAALATSTMKERVEVAGVRTQEVLTYRVVDARLVPREFLSVDDKKVRAHIAAHGESPIPGIVIEKETRVVAARGR